MSGVLGLQLAGASALVAVDGSVVEPSGDAGMLQAGPYRSLPVRHDIEWSRHHIPTRRQIKDVIQSMNLDISPTQMDFLIDEVVNNAPSISIPKGVHTRIHNRIDGMQFDSIEEAVAHNNRITDYELGQYRYIEDGIEYRFRHERISEVMGELERFQSAFPAWLEARVAQELATAESLKRQSRGRSERELRERRLNDMEEKDTPRKRRRRGGFTNLEQEMPVRVANAEYAEADIVLAAAGVIYSQDNDSNPLLPHRVLPVEGITLA